MITLLIILTIYLLSVFGMYKWIQTAHYHNNGIYKNIDTDGSYLFFTFIPVINTILLIMWIILYPIENERAINFFKPKNYDKTT